MGSVAIDTANAPPGQKLETALSGGARLGGSLAGAETWCRSAAVGGPWGAPGGPILGGIGCTEAVKSIQNAAPMDEQTRTGMGIVF